MVKAKVSTQGARYECVQVTKLLDMREGYAPIRNILGMSDPNVNFIDGQWTMFIGGMGFDFKTNILRATLPKGDTLESNNWQFDMVEGSKWRARRIIEQPRKGSWNRCLHSVCYVRGKVDGKVIERIYHAGRNAESVLSTKVPYKIGYLEKQEGKWMSIDQPLKIKGLIGYDGVLEPKVEFRNGYWHMRYLALTTPGDDKNGNHTILYSKSKNGQTDWSEPMVFTDAREGYYDSVSIPDAKGGHIMALTRDSNLFGRVPYPKQGIWISHADTYSGDRSSWSDPTLVVDPAQDSNGWYVNGMCSPTILWSDGRREQGVLYVFFVSATEHTNWLKRLITSSLRLKFPPVPAPFYFAIGKAKVIVNKD